MRSALRLTAAAALLAASLALVAAAQAPPGEWKTVSFAILEDYDKGDDLRDIEADFRLFHALEIDTWRGSFGWDDYEPSPGRLDFDWLHRFAELAGRHQIRLRPYLAYTPEWAARRGGADLEVWNNPPRDLRDWDRFATAIAAALRRHPNVLSYEIYNEVNVQQWWDGTAADYARLLSRGARAITKGDPDAAVLFGGLVFPDTEWIEGVCGAAAESASGFSVLPVHAYPETWTPPGVTAENYLNGLPEFAAEADGRCGHKAIWINETGFATVPGRSELDQAYWWVRAVASFLAVPRVEHIGVYEIKDLRGDRPAIGDAPNYHLGLARTDRTPKLAFYTVDLLTDLLDVGKLKVDRATISVIAGVPGELHHWLFERPDGRRVLFVWDRTGSPTVRIQLPGVETLIEYEIDGRAETMAEPPGEATFALQPGVPRIFLLF